MSLPKIVRDELTRLGATYPEGAASDAISALTEQVEYSEHTFDSTVARCREVLTRIGETSFDGMSDEDLAGEVPLIRGMSFSPIVLDYENDFVGVRSNHNFFAADIYHYFFLVENPDDHDDPLVFALDHEDVSQEPERFMYSLPSTCSTLLGLLEPSSKTSAIGEDDFETTDFAEFWKRSKENRLLSRVIDYFEDEIDEDSEGEDDLARYVTEFFAELSEDETEDFYAGIQNGGEIAARMNAVREACGSQFQFTSDTKDVTADEAMILVKETVRRFQSFATVSGDEALVQLLSVSNIVSHEADDNGGCDFLRSEVLKRGVATFRSLCDAEDGGEPMAKPLLKGLERLYGANVILLPYVPVWQLGFPIQIRSRHASNCGYEESTGD